MTVSLKGLRERIGGRQRERHRLDLRTLTREPGRQRPHTGQRRSVFAADIDRQRTEARARCGEQVGGRVAQHLLDNLYTGATDTDHMYTIRKRIGIGDAVHTTAQGIELALLQLGLGAADGRRRPASHQIDPCSDGHE